MYVPITGFKINPYFHQFFRQLSPELQAILITMGVSEHMVRCDRIEKKRKIVEAEKTIHELRIDLNI